MRFSRSHYSTGVILSGVALAANAVAIRSPLVGVPALASFGILASLGAVAWVRGGATETFKLSDLFHGAFLLAAGWTVLATAVYYLWRLDAAVILLLLALASVPGLVAFRGRKSVTIAVARVPVSLRSIAVGAVLLVALAGAAGLLANTGTTEAVRSPWEVLPLRFLVLLGLASFATSALAFIRGGRRIAVTGALATLALGLLVAASVYRIGYGFDPFIHEAAMREIASRGEVLPKTPYYIGMYADVVSVSTLTGLPLHDLMRIAGPTVGTLALSDAAAMSAATIGAGALLPIAILLAALGPLSHFIATTPQGMADALALVTVAFALRAARKEERWLFAALAALAAWATHPLAGAPALGIVLLLWSHARITGAALRRTLAACLLGGLVLYPTATFLLQTPIATELSLQGAPERLLALGREMLSIPDVRTFSGARTLLYTGRTLTSLLLVLLAALSLRRESRERGTKTLLFSAGLATALGGTLLAAIVQLRGVIGYEETIFPLRFLLLGGIFLFPLALGEALAIIARLAQTPLRRLALTLMLSLTLPSLIYLAYPRIDPEDRSSGRSVSGSTIAAVELIRDIGEGTYVVLANQTAAAAEIWRHGFSRYVKGEFYYSHPSGSLRLYRYFLSATRDSSIPGAEGPTRALFAEAMNAYGVDRAYFVLHDYWRRFPELVEEAKKTADGVYDIDGGKVMIFEYQVR